MSEIELHRKLLGDHVRNEALFRALSRVIRPGVTSVVDLGAGTGFISFLARQLGARSCTLIEYTDVIDVARVLARKNRITGLSFVKVHSREIAKPPKADVVISETLGNYALEENLLETLVDGRRFLTDGGVLVPSRLRQFVCPVTSRRLQDETDIWRSVGFELDLEPARTVALNNMYVKTIRLDDLGGSEAAARCWDDIDFRAPSPPSSLRRAVVRWPAADLPTLVEGFALWWEAELVPGVLLSTAPSSPPTHWEQVYLPLLRPIQLGAQEELELTLTSDTRPDVGVRVAWQTRKLHGGKPLDTQAQDMAKGRL